MLKLVVKLQYQRQALAGLQGDRENG